MAAQNCGNQYSGALGLIQRRLCRGFEGHLDGVIY